MSDIDANHFGLLLEQIVDQNKAVLEAVGDMQQKVAVLLTIQRDIAELKQDMKVIKASVRSLASQVHDHEMRISGLETA